MKIALCDDQKSVWQEFGQRIKKFDDTHGVRSEVLCFSKPSELFSYMQKETVELVFMDLEFMKPEEDGILWLKKINRQFPHTLFIILTAYEQRYKEGFEVRAFRFMTKPLEEEELFEYLAAGMEELKLTESIVLVRRGIPHKILVRDICYLSAQSGGSLLWTATDMYCCEESLLQWEKRLPETAFFRCHSKYLVNLGHVRKPDHQTITLDNGRKLAVSRRKWKAFQLAYMKYDTI